MLNRGSASSISLFNASTYLSRRYCIYVLDGHTSTIRCIKVLHNRPIAVTGSRDSTLRVWDVQFGRMLRVLEGHQQSVRCLDVCGNKVVSGSYDTTCRVGLFFRLPPFFFLTDHPSRPVVGCRYGRMCPRASGSLS